MMFLSDVNGLSRINYPNSRFMKSIRFDRLYGQEVPRIFHNAFDLDKQDLAFLPTGK
jgi:hypothetical protein